MIPKRTGRIEDANGDNRSRIKAHTLARWPADWSVGDKARRL